MVSGRPGDVEFGTNPNGQAWRPGHSAGKTLRNRALDIMTSLSGVGPTTDRRGRARADRSLSAVFCAVRPDAAPFLRAARRANRAQAKATGRTHRRSAAWAPGRLRRQGVRSHVALAARCFHVAQATYSLTPPRRGVSGGSPPSRHPNWSFAHDVRRWRLLRLRSARRPPPRRSGAGRRVGCGDVASGRAAHDSHRQSFPPALHADVRGAAQALTLSFTPYRRRASRRRNERVRFGSGARLSHAGLMRRRARPAQKSLPWQTKC